MTFSSTSRRLAASALLTAAAACTSVRPIDRSAWNADLDALLAHLPGAYANLEYAIRTRRLNAESLATRARTQIADARTTRGGRAALANFLDAFGDYHISLATSPSPGPRDRNSTPTYASCKDLGFRGRDRSFHRAIRDQPGFTEDHGGVFPAARITGDAGAARVVRIPLFSQSQFPELCQALWPRFASSDTCNESCADSLWSAVGDSALADLGARLSPDASSTTALLVVDLTGNGGGSEWVVDVAQRLTPRRLALPPVGMVRHDHWRSALERRAARAADSSERARAQSLLRELATSCDWNVIWRGNAPPPCSPLVIDTPRVHIGDTAGSPVIWRGPILIVTDARTASASEEFVAMLVDAGVAQTVGQRTMGIGCGFTNGGIDFRLPRSGLRVRLPDCARFRRDGTNERAGIHGDLGAWDTDVSAAGRADILGKAIRAAQTR